MAQNNSNRAQMIEGRTTCHEGYAVSQRTRKRIEDGVDGARTIGGMRKGRFVIRAKSDFQFMLNVAAYEPVRTSALTVASRGWSLGIRVFSQ